MAKREFFLSKLNFSEKNNSVKEFICYEKGKERVKVKKNLQKSQTQGIFAFKTQQNRQNSIFAEVPAT